MPSKRRSSKRHSSHRRPRLSQRHFRKAHREEKKLVMLGVLHHTRSGLTRNDLELNSKGVPVSKKRRRAAFKNLGAYMYQ